jgi:preprotein translocase subunit SecD
MRGLALLVALGSLAACRSNDKLERFGRAPGSATGSASAPIVPAQRITDGLHIVYIVQPPAELQRTLAVVRKRIAGVGLAADARSEGDRLVVDIAGGKPDEIARAKDLIATPRNLEISSASDPNPAITNDMIASARVGDRVGDIPPSIWVELDSTGRKQLEALGKQNIGKEIVIAIDGLVVSRPTVIEPTITGRFFFQLPTKGYDIDGDARVLVAALQSGRMPAKLLEESVSLLRGGVVQPNP